VSTKEGDYDDAEQQRKVRGRLGKTGELGRRGALNRRPSRGSDDDQDLFSVVTRRISLVAAGSRTVTLDQRFALRRLFAQFSRPVVQPLLGAFLGGANARAVLARPLPSATLNSTRTASMIGPALA